MLKFPIIENTQLNEELFRDDFNLYFYGSDSIALQLKASISELTYILNLFWIKYWDTIIYEHKINIRDFINLYEMKTHIGTFINARGDEFKKEMQKSPLHGALHSAIQIDVGWFVEGLEKETRGEIYAHQEGRRGLHHERPIQGQQRQGHPGLQTQMVHLCWETLKGQSQRYNRFLNINNRTTRNDPHQAKPVCPHQT
jgi:hypothetical protein